MCRACIIWCSVQFLQFIRAAEPQVSLISSSHCLLLLTAVARGGENWLQLWCHIISGKKYMKWLRVALGFASNSIVFTILIPKATYVISIFFSGSDVTPEPSSASHILSTAHLPVNRHCLATKDVHFEKYWFFFGSGYKGTEKYHYSQFSGFQLPVYYSDFWGRVGGVVQYFRASLFPIRIFLGSWNSYFLKIIAPKLQRSSWYISPK